MHQHICGFPNKIDIFKVRPISENDKPDVVAFLNMIEFETIKLQGFNNASASEKKKQRRSVCIL